LTTRAWTERGRSRKRSTYTADSATAQAILAKKINKRRERPGPSDPSEIVVTGVLSHYATKRAPEVEAPRVIGCAIDALTGFWQARAVVDVTPETCSAYGEWRSRSQNTGRLSTVLQAAINYAHKCGRITRSVIVTLLAKPQSKERWLTNHEAALLLRALCAHRRYQERFCCRLQTSWTRGRHTSRSQTHDSLVDHSVRLIFR
jgi:hypothetical protein